MKKILTFLEKTATWLCSFSPDKYVHIMVCAVLTLLVAVFVRMCFGDDGYICVGIGACAAMIVGFFKEWYDNFTDGEFGYFDLVADAVGCALSAALLCLWTWCLGV